MNTGRRRFVAMMAGGAAGLGVWACTPGRGTGETSRDGSSLFLGGGRFVDPEGDGAVRHVMATSRMDGADPALYPVGFFPHGIVIDPANPDRLALFEKKGPGACEIDLAAGGMSRTLAPQPGCHFYGHGVFSSDGGLLYATETYLDTQQGAITVRDARDRTLLGEFPTFGTNPHDCRLFDGGRQLAITNAGGAIGGDLPAVTYVDIESGRLEERIELGHERINAGHLFLTAALDLVVVSAPRDGLPTTEPGGISLRPAGRSIQTMTAPADLVNRLTGESLSVAVHEPTGTVAVTNPDADRITFWDLAEQRLISSIRIPSPRGVALTLDDSHFVFSFGPDASLIRVSTATLEPDEEGTVGGTYITGSHIVNWTREVAALARG